MRVVKILVVDDVVMIREGVSEILRMDGYHVETAGDTEQAMKIIDDIMCDIVILDIKLPGMNGFEFLKYIKNHNPDTEVIIITGYASLESAVEVIREGAFAYIPKPFTAEHLRVVVKKAIEKQGVGLRGELYKREAGQDSENFIVGKSRAFRDVYKMIYKTGPTDCTMLITGESGTGKELVAREIHAHSGRKDQPFVTVDCGALVETLFESELFGHVKGAFTGATETRRGWFQLAEGGTIFLDEISNISTNIQAKLLRAIQEKEISPVGGNRVLKVDVRIIAATNRNLEECVEEGAFREDLFYRLNAFPIQLPPLRERKADIPALAEHFVRKYCKIHRRKLHGIADETMSMLMSYDWPGNIRELENIIGRAVIIEEKNIITPGSVALVTGKVAKNSNGVFSEQLTLDELEKKYLKYVLERCRWKKTEAAKILGIDRKSLYNRIQKYNLSPLNTPLEN